MLRITVQELPQTMTLKLEGSLAGPWVAEFGRTWQMLAPALGQRTLSLDLRGVTFVDTEGRLLLSEIYRETGAAFLADTPLTQYFAQEARESQPDDQVREREEERGVR